ncbi:MAG: hypothetical protein V7784_20380 [Oceanospirillaceae bacterium]
MKILSSDISFNSKHSHQRTEFLKHSVSLKTPDSGAKAVLYSSNSYSEQYNRVGSSSTIHQNNRVSHIQKTQSTLNVIQNSIGPQNEIGNLLLSTPSGSPTNSIGANAYQNIENHSSKNPPTNFYNYDQQAKLEITEQYFVSENERLRVNARGTITTEDDKKIDFMLKLEMSRNFKFQSNLSIIPEKLETIDPLVINLSGGTASLTSSSFSFDLNSDGKDDSISFVGKGSGFLAIDRNEDGRINNGSELFGTQGQSGFKDLSRYDNDNNLWIDENDPIFDKLKAWTHSKNLISLKDAGIGAIYLGSAKSEFSLTDSDNNLLGQVKRSGVFLTEGGEVASIQELDLAIHSKDKNNSRVFKLDNTIINMIERLKSQDDLLLDEETDKTLRLQNIIENIEKDHNRIAED